MPVRYLDTPPKKSRIRYLDVAPQPVAPAAPPSPSAEPSVYETILANQKAAEAHGLDPYQNNMRIAAQAQADSRTGVGRSFPARLVVDPFKAVGHQVGGAVGSVLSEAGMPGAQEATEQMQNQERLDAAERDILNNGSTIKNLAQGAADVVGVAGYAGLLGGGNAGAAAMFGGTTGLNALAESRAKGEKGAAPLVNATAHGVIEGAWTYVGGKYLGAGVSKIWGATGENVVGKAVEKIATKYKLPKWPAHVVGGAGGEVLEEASTEATHYLADVAQGREQFKAGELGRRMWSVVPVAAVSGGAGHAIRSYVNRSAAALENRYRETANVTKAMASASPEAIQAFAENPSRRTAKEAGVDQIAPTQRERAKLAEGVKAAAAVETPKTSVEFTPQHDAVYGTDSFSAIMRDDGGKEIGRAIGDIRDGKLIVQNIGIDDAHRGKGSGKEFYRELIKNAQERGLQFVSDRSVTEDAAHVYESLAREGYQVTKHPDAIEGVSDDGHKLTQLPQGTPGHVFEVTPPAENATPAPQATTSPVDATRPETANEPSQPPIAPTDAAEGVARAPEEGLAAKNASMAAARESLGLPELPESQRKGWEENLSEAFDAGIPDKAMDIARSLPSREDPLSATETAGLLAHGVDLKNQHAAASAELDTLTDPADIATKQAELDRIEADFDVLSTALKTTGTEQGRALAIRKMQLDDDYSIIAVKRRAKQKAKRELKPNEAKTLERLTKKLDELESHIENGTLPEGVKRTRTESPEAKVLRDQIASARKELARSEPAQKARLEKSIAELRRRLTEGDYGPSAGKPVPLSPELEMLEFQRDQIRKEIRAKINGLKPLRKRDIALEPFNLFRILMTSGDLPPVFRQGGIVTLSRPVTSAKAAMAGLKAMFSEKNAWKVQKEIESRPNAPLYARARLYIADREGGVTAKEEAYANRGLARLADSLDRVPGVRHAVRGVKGFVLASERNYVTYLNRLRADTFDAMVENLARDGEPTMAEAHAIANYINVATGRGSFGDMENAMSALAPVFFSPRYVASRFQYIGLQPLVKGDAATRKLIAKEYARTLTGIAVVMGLGMAAGAELEDDWTSPDKGKLKFGDTRLDLMGGLSQTAVVSARAMDAAKRTASAYYNGADREPGQLRDDALIPWNFARQKFSPLVSAPLDWVAGETVMHEKTTPGSTIKNLSVPISFRDIAKTMEDQGIPRGTALFAISLFGGGMNTYEPKPPKPPNIPALMRSAQSEPTTPAGWKRKMAAIKKLQGQ